MRANERVHFMFGASTLRRGTRSGGITPPIAALLPSPDLVPADPALFQEKSVEVVEHAEVAHVNKVEAK
jgi:hypothetical protein